MYANSTDGLRWRKPDLGIYDATNHFPAIPKAEAKQNNIVMYGGGLGVFKDAHETNPALRYKIAGGSPAGCYSASGATDCVVGGRFPGRAARLEGDPDAGFPRPLRPDCHTNAFWDETTGQYLMTTRATTWTSRRPPRLGAGRRTDPRKCVIGCSGQGV